MCTTHSSQHWLLSHCRTDGRSLISFYMAFYMDYYMAEYMATLWNLLCLNQYLNCLYLCSAYSEFVLMLFLFESDYLVPGTYWWITHIQQVVPCQRDVFPLAGLGYEIVKILILLHIRNHWGHRSPLVWLFWLVKHCVRSERCRLAFCAFWNNL